MTSQIKGIHAYSDGEKFLDTLNKLKHWLFCRESFPWCGANVFVWTIDSHIQMQHQEQNQSVSIYDCATFRLPTIVLSINQQGSSDLRLSMKNHLEFISLHEINNPKLLISLAIFMHPCKTANMINFTISFVKTLRSKENDKKKHEDGQTST